MDKSGTTVGDSTTDPGCMSMCLGGRISKNTLNATLGVGAVILLLLGLFALTPLGIFGERTALINRYYAARTLHMHKMTTSAVIPAQWNSLGLTHAYVNVNSALYNMFPAMYVVGSGYTPEKETENAANCMSKTYTDESGKSHNYATYKFPVALRCILESSSDYFLYVNAVSLSVLSHISPAVYLATLLVIYQLSLVYFIFGVFFNRSEAEVLQARESDAETDSRMRRMSQGFLRRVFETGGDHQGKLHAWWGSVRDFCCYCVLAWYALFLAMAVLEPSTQTVDWGPERSKQTVEYYLNSNISSVLYCVIVLVLYYKRASKEYPYWEYLFPRDPLESTEGTGKLGFVSYASDQLQKFGGVPTYNQYGVGQMYNQYAAAQGSFNPVMTHSMHVPLQMPVQTEANRQGVLMDQAGAVTRKWNSAEQKYHRNFIFGGNKQLGPVSNETSTIVSLTVFLGGIANLGMARGVLLETEAQFVIVCLFSFAVLEFGRTHLFSYFWYLMVHVLEGAPNADLQNCELFSHTKMIRVILIFVDVVVFLLQVIIVVMWQMTMDTLLVYSTDPLRVFLVVVVSLFLLVRLFSVVYGFYELFRLFSYAANQAENIDAYMTGMRDGDLKYGKNVSMVVWQSEKYLYLLTTWLMIIGILAISANSDATTPPAEARLRFAEKILYKAAAKHNANNACALGVQRNPLLSTILTSSCDENEVMKQDESVDPVDMKVFAWSRWWQMNDKPVIMSKQDVCSKRDCAEYSLLFCSGGFEQHWGQCKTEYFGYHLHAPRDNWAAEVLDNMYAFQGTSALKSLPLVGARPWLALPPGTSLSTLPDHHAIVDGQIVHTHEP
jgi:hypothetical protein